MSDAPLTPGEQDTADTSPEDRRLHLRLPLRAYAEVQYSTKTWEAHVLDLSLTGARVAILSEHLLRKGDALRLQILMEDFPLHTPTKSLRLHGVIAHSREHILGFAFQPDTPADKNLLVSLLDYLSDQQSAAPEFSNYSDSDS